MTLTVGEAISIRRMDANTIDLIRHAHAAWRGDDAQSLSESGRAAAELVADKLALQPVAAIYSSPSASSLQTIAPLAKRLDLTPELVADLRERELPSVAPEEFDTLVSEAWQEPTRPPRGGESNVEAQERGLAVVRRVVSLHHGLHVVVCTHGNLLALTLNGLNPAFGYDIWRQLSFLDVYRLTFDDSRLVGVVRVWDAA